MSLNLKNKHGVRVIYGSSHDSEYGEKIPSIEILYMIIWAEKNYGAEFSGFFFEMLPKNKDD